MKGFLPPGLPSWVQLAFDRLLLLALLVMIGLSMRACVRNVAHAIGLKSLSNSEQAAHERSALSSD